MGSYISIGIVFSVKEKDQYFNRTRTVIECISEGEKNLQYKSSRDNLGHNWIEMKSNISDFTELKFQQWMSGCYQEMLIETPIIANHYHNILLRIFDEIEYYGIQIDIEERLAQDIGYNIFEKKILNFLTKLYDLIEYDYAFCEHEGEIDKSLSELLEEVYEQYSILVLPKDGLLEIRKSNWSLDGITSRE